MWDRSIRTIQLWERYVVVWASDGVRLYVRVGLLVFVLQPFVCGCEGYNWRRGRVENDSILVGQVANRELFSQAFVEQLQTSYACFALLRVLCFSLIAPFSQCFFFAIFSFDYNRALLELLLAVMS